MTHDHESRIVDQFTRQAVPFTQVAGHLNAIDHLITFAEASSTDIVLDVACGPGLVACAFAHRCAQVTGVDLTPAMIDQARERQRTEGLANARWQVGGVQPLPFDNSAFSLVISRYSFHHFESPRDVLAEMIRVCKPGGRVMLADVSMPPDKSVAYDQLEVLRDPSHVHALTDTEFEDLFAQSGLTQCQRSHYGVDIELEAQLRASFPKPGDLERIRQAIVSDIGADSLGIQARREKHQVNYTVPIAVYVGYKAY